MKFLASAKSKVLAGVAAVSVLSSNALAAGITMASDGTVTGDLNVGPFIEYRWCCSCCLWRILRC